MTRKPRRIRQSDLRGAWLDELADLLVPLDELTEDSRNARRHGDQNRAAVEASLTRFGQNLPLIATRAGVVVAGNLRLQAMRALGWTHAAVVRISDADAQAYALADNRTAELAEWDDEQLAVLLREITAGGDDATLAALGWSDDELAALITELADGAGEAPAETRHVEFDARDAVPDKVPERCRVGDVWQLGTHLLVCGDAFDAELLDRALPEPVDLVLTDPPFAIFGSSTGVGGDVADDRMVRPFFSNLGKVIAARTRISAHVYVCCDWRSYPALADGIRDSATALAPANLLVWEKGGAGLGTNYMNSYELVAFLHHKPRRTSIVNKRAREHANLPSPRPVPKSNIVRCARVGAAEKEHAAQKPVELFEQLIENSTDPGQLVLDLFAGSGTTIIACEETSRRAVAVEVEPHRCDVILARWERLGGKSPRKLTPPRKAKAKR